MHGEFIEWQQKRYNQNMSDGKQIFSLTQLCVILIIVRSYRCVDSTTLDIMCEKTTKYRPIGEIYKLSKEELQRTLRDHKYLKAAVPRMNGKLDTTNGRYVADFCSFSLLYWKCCQLFIGHSSHFHRWPLLERAM